MSAKNESAGRKWKKRLGIAMGLVAVLLGVVVGRAKWVVDRTYADVPEPAIRADRSPEGVARGEMLFQSICIQCHGGADGRATGKKLDDVPAFLGELYAANLTHPEHGVRALGDGKIARAIRNGVVADGRLSVAMSNFSTIGDADVAALLGYMRSGASVFDPSPEVQPRSRLTLTGAVIITWVAGLDPRSAPATIAVPPKDDTLAYGAYMVQTLDCVGCHTDGFGSDKMHDPKAFAGGFELADPSGAKIYTKNLTADDETGIGRWSEDDFARAVTRGTTPDGYLVRKPMPLFSRLDRADTDAIYAYLRRVPKVRQPNRPGGAPLERANPNDRPEALFAKLGCATCHGDGAPHRDKIAAAIDKPDEDVAAWILDPQTKKPGSAMPSFKGTIDDAQALSLARYAKALARTRLAAR